MRGGRRVAALDHLDHHSHLGVARVLRSRTALRPTRKRGRADECTGLENQRVARHRRFESSRFRYDSFGDVATPTSMPIRFSLITTVPAKLQRLKRPLRKREVVGSNPTVGLRLGHCRREAQNRDARPLPGRIAQRESAASTRQKSKVRSLLRPSTAILVRLGEVAQTPLWLRLRMSTKRAVSVGFVSGRGEDGGMASLPPLQSRESWC